MSDRASYGRHGSGQAAQPLLVGRGDQGLPARVKAFSFSGHRRNETVTQREPRNEPKRGGPETRARSDFGGSVLRVRISIAGVEEVQGVFRGKNRDRNCPGLNLQLMPRWTGLKGGRGIFDRALRRANRLSRDRGDPDCGRLKIGGELRCIHDLQNRPAEARE